MFKRLETLLLDLRRNEFFPFNMIAKIVFFLVFRVENETTFSTLIIISMYDHPMTQLMLLKLCPRLKCDFAIE